MSTSVSVDPILHAGRAPRLDRSRGVARLIVDGSPFLIRGVELHNSSSSSRDALAWGLKSAVGVEANTVLAPVTWEQVEPEEGRFEFGEVTELIESTRLAGLRLVILWFGAWKNASSSYSPGWVKRDTDRFGRCVLEDGRVTEALSPFTDEALDAPAFGALMQHLEGVDRQHRTVLMVQVENEVGLLGGSRDHSPAANAAFHAPVPEHVSRVLAGRPAEARGARTDSWSAALPSPERSDEAFMAYAIASHVERVAREGRAHSELPFFVNAWLDSDLDIDLPGFAVAGGQGPGDYPSGGPLPQVADIWRACAPSIDLLAPDLYFGDSRRIFRDFQASSGGLFVPEMRRDVVGVGHIFEAIGEFHAVGVSPFGVDSGTEEDLRPLADAYAVLARAGDLITDPASGGRGFFLTDQRPQMELDFGGLRMTVSRVIAIGADPAGSVGYGLIRQLAPEEFAAVGRGFRITFTALDDDKRIGIESVREILDATGRLGRRLNGDETSSGTAWAHPHPEPMPTVHFPIPMGHRHSGVSVCRTYSYARMAG